MKARGPKDVPNFVAGVEPPNFVAGVEPPNFVAGVEPPNFVAAVDSAEEPTLTDAPGEASERNIESFLRSAFRPVRTPQ